jgi:hypothetical protein
MKMRYVWVVMLLVSGCDIQSGADALCADSLSLGFEGNWTLMGEGELSGCPSEKNYNGEVKLDSNLWEVRESGASESIDGIEDGVEEVLDELTGAQMVNLIGVNLPAGFSLENAEAVGNTLSFTTREETSDGEIVMEFTGKREGCGYVEGSFTGSGPGTCEFTGNFTLFID